MNKNIRFAFFGTPELAAVFLDDLAAGGLSPSLVVTTPDRKQGRGMEMAPPAVKKWAEARAVQVLQPDEWDASSIADLQAACTELQIEVFVVIYYGKLLPKVVLDMPKHGVLNIHFSLLPRWRGTSPVRASIANDDKVTGTSIILLDEKLDHGPIIAQKRIPTVAWPPRATELEELATHESAKLLLEILPSWLRGEIEAREQNHDIATLCPSYTKEDGLLDLRGDAYQNLLKIRAFDTTVGTHTFFERPSTNSGQAAKKIRVGIVDAHIENGPSTSFDKAQDKSLRAGKLIIDRVKPEGKKEMGYEEFLRSGARPTS